MENKSETKVTRKSETKIRRADYKVRRPIFGYHRPIKPGNSLKGHKKLAVFLFLFFTIAGGVTAFLMNPVYTSEALIEVKTDYETNLGNKGRNPLQQKYQIGRGYEEFAQSQVVMIKDYSVLNPALLQMGDLAKMWDQGEEKRLAWTYLADELIVKRVAGTYLISVSLESSDPKGLKETINAVVDVYLKMVRGFGMGSEDKRIINLRQSKREVEAKLNALITRKTSLAEELGVVITGDEALKNPYADSMEYLRRSFVEANISHLEAQANFTALKEALENKYKSKDEITAEAIARVEANPVVQKQMYELQSEKAKLWGKINQISPDYAITIKEKDTDARREATPEEEDNIRTAMEQDISSLISQVSTLERGYNNLFARAVQREVEAIMRENNQLLADAETKANETGRIRDNLEEEIKKYNEEMMTYSTRYNEAIDVQNDLDRFREQLRNINDELDAFDTEKNAPGAIEKKSDARDPDEPSNKYRYAVLAGFFFIALVTSVGVPIGLDYINPWVMQPNDVQAILHFPALGWLLYREDEKTESFARDQLRRLALTINEKRLQEKRRSIVITSVKPGGGATELSLSLAQEMNVIGVNTVVIEANAFRPDSRYASMDTPGLIEVLNGEKTVAEVILPATGDLPDRIPVGNTHNRRHLPERGQMKNVINELQEKYDLCLLDAPPILLSADAESLTRMGDATIMVVEAQGITLNEMARAAASLERLSPSAMAVVVNQVRVYEGGYYADVLKEYLAGTKAPPRGLLAKTMLKRGRKKKSA